MEQNELVLEAEYADIILSLLSEPYQISSVTKIIFMSFCIKHENNMLVYRKRTKDFVDVFFRNISLKLMTNYNDLRRIIHVIDMLNKTKMIKVTEDTIEVKEKITHIAENAFIKMCEGKAPNPLLEINKLDAKSVIEEVIRYV